MGRAKPYGGVGVELIRAKVALWLSFAFSPLEKTIADCTAAVADIEARKAEAEAQLSVAGGLRRLLYEQGRPLEDAILEAMRLFGFEAQKHSDGKSEFDAVLVSPEGRCIGEVEGKDKKAVNIDKFSQLERNIHEDFEREDVVEHAKGVLFGNACRFLPPEERTEFFTEKCLAAAKRVGAALVRTPDLFEPAKYLKENPLDSAYAQQCREAIFQTEGDVVKLPNPPLRGASALIEDDERADSAAASLENDLAGGGH